MKYKKVILNRILLNLRRLVEQCQFSADDYVFVECALRALFKLEAKLEVEDEK